MEAEASSGYLTGLSTFLSVAKEYILSGGKTALNDHARKGQHKPEPIDALGSKDLLGACVEY